VRQAGMFAGRALLENHVPRLLAVLAAAVEKGPTAEMRQTALRCLLACMELPYASVFPYRGLALPAIAAARDDRKRVVRLEAARVHRAWAPLV
jgi:hypothetical protein